MSSQGSRYLGLVAALALLVTPAARSQDDNAGSPNSGGIPAVSTYVAPVPLDRRTPVYPGTERDRYREGWVALSYIVTATGEVKDAMIEDSTGNEDFEESALNAVRRWRFEPAKRDGVAVDQAMTRTIVRFQFDGTVTGASDAFRDQYREIQELIAAGALVKAEELLTHLQYEERLNLYEDAWFWWLRYLYLDATGNAAPADLKESLQRAIGYDDYLRPDMFVAAAGRLFVQHLRTNDLSAAIRTFERLSDSAGARRSDTYAQVHEAMAQQVSEIRNVINSDATLAVPARVGRNSYWVHDLLRRSFSLTDVQNGELRALDIRCERRNVKYDEVAAEQTWNIPVSWGECGIYVQGTPGTTFAFLEFPSTP